MEHLLRQVQEFMVAAGQHVGRHPGDISVRDEQLGLGLIAEEFRELQTALIKDPGTERLVEIADALADLLYVTAWTALAYGLPMASVMDEVHRSNMDKFGPGSTKAPNGKQLKPPGWQPPRIRTLLTTTTAGATGGAGGASVAAPVLAAADLEYTCPKQWVRDA